VAPRDNPSGEIPQSATRLAPRPSEDELRAAVRTLIAGTGDDPDREGLVDTPDRVVRAFAEWFVGYRIEPTDLLRAGRQMADGSSDVVMMREIALASHCDHHIAPILGTVDLAYAPGKFLAAAEDIVRAVDAVAHRLQSQETMTVQIARAIEEAIEPRGVAVIVSAQHLCMTTRGVRQTTACTVTMQLRGAFRDDPIIRQDILNLLRRR